MPVKILQKENPILRKIAKNVDLEDIKNGKINRIIEEMKEALESQDDGVAIAAPQIGYDLRIFVVSGKVEEIIKEEAGEEFEPKKKYKDSIFINPVIKKTSKEKRWVEEGCLSVRYLYGKVERSTKTTVEALDENGKKFTRGGSGLMAQIFQHEIDHLDGVLFTDKAEGLEEIPPTKNNKK